MKYALLFLVLILSINIWAQDSEEWTDMSSSDEALTHTPTVEPEATSEVEETDYEYDY